MPSLKLNLGCGRRIMKGYTNVDVAPERAGKQPDVICDIRNLYPFETNSVDEILSVHVVEHFHRYDIKYILKEWLRVLKPGRLMIIECPNLIEACKEIIANPERTGDVKKIDAQMGMWPMYGDPLHQDELMMHKWGYTPHTLINLLRHIGLNNVSQQPCEFKKRDPRDMRVVGYK